MSVDCNLEIRPVNEGSRKSLREPQTPEAKTPKRKTNKETKKNENGISKDPKPLKE